jgi:nitrilase
MQTYPAFKVAAMHVSPIFLDTGKTVEKVCSLIAEAARQGAKLIAFPEAFVPAFPLWSSVRAPITNHDFFRRLAANAVKVPGPEIRRVAQAAKEHQVIVSLGINEGTDASVGCIWNSNVLIGEGGRLLNHHRKIVPTYFEKMSWANGDGAGLRVVETLLGRIGMLICGENGNPLARYTLMAQGEQVHIANYPSLWRRRPLRRGQAIHHGIVFIPYRGCEGSNRRRRQEDPRYYGELSANRIADHRTKRRAKG